jgi:hypothetical protein
MHSEIHTFISYWWVWCGRNSFVIRVPFIVRVRFTSHEVITRRKGYLQVFRLEYVLLEVKYLPAGFFCKFVPHVRSEERGHHLQGLGWLKI